MDGEGGWVRGVRRGRSSRRTKARVIFELNLWDYVQLDGVDRAHPRTRMSDMSCKMRFNSIQYTLTRRTIITMIMMKITLNRL